MKHQMKISNHPCIIPSIIDSRGEACSHGKYRRLYIDMNFENVGNATALGVFVVGHFELEHIEDADTEIAGKFRLPAYIPCIKSDISEKSYILFEAKETWQVIKETEELGRLLRKRLREDNWSVFYYGPNLVVETYYKNILGQWFQTTLKARVNFLRGILDDGSEVDYISPVAPDDIELLPDDIRFKLHFASENESPVVTMPIDSKIAESILSNFDGHFPDYKGTFKDKKITKF